MQETLVRIEHLDDIKFNKIITDLKKDESTKDFHFNNNSSYGIFYNNELVGLIGLSLWYPDNLTITICILNEYRGKGIASIAINQLVETFGKTFPEIKNFIYNAIPNNISSNKVAKKLGWEETSSFDDAMLEEGAEIFNMYYKENPYYLKGDEKKL